MNKRRLLALAFSTAMTTAACGSSMNTPDIQHNPRPKMRYELTLTIQDAPGPFESAEGYMQYEVTDKRCSPENPISGTWNPPFKDVPIEFKRIGGSTYLGTVYLDLLVDEDYYGLGVCHWNMVGVTTQIKYQGVIFSSYISSEKIVLQQPTTGYLAKRAYGNAGLKGLADAAMPMSEIVAQHRDDFFSTTLIAKEHLE